MYMSVHVYGSRSLGGYNSCRVWCRKMKVMSCVDAVLCSTCRPWSLSLSLSLARARARARARALSLSPSLPLSLSHVCVCGFVCGFVCV